MEDEMYTIHEFDKWPFRMLIMAGDVELIGIDRSAYSTADTLQITARRPENIKQYAAINQLIERANRDIAAEAQRDAARLELAAVLDRERIELIEWSTRVDEQFKLRQQATASNIAAISQRDELAAQLATVTEERDRYERELCDIREICNVDDEDLTVDIVSRVIREMKLKLQAEASYTGWIDKTQQIRAFERTAPLDWRSDYNDETADYWLTTFSEWAEALLMPPQNDEAQAVIEELKTLAGDLAYECMLHNRTTDSWGNEITRRESAERGFAKLNQSYTDAMTELSRYRKVTA